MTIFFGKIDTLQFICLTHSSWFRANDDCFVHLPQVVFALSRTPTTANTRRFMGPIFLHYLQLFFVNLYHIP